MSSTLTKYKAEHCINGKDDGKETGPKPDMCNSQDNSGGKKADPAPAPTLEMKPECLWERWSLPIGKRTAKEPRKFRFDCLMSCQLMANRQLLGEFAGPGKDGEKIEIESEEDWEGKVGRYLIVQMDQTDKPDSLNLKEVTAFGKQFVYASPQCQ